MNCSLNIRLVLGMLATASCVPYTFGGVAEQLHPLRLKIHLCNRSPACSRTLNQATREASRIIAATGVDIVWQTSPVDAPEANITDQHGIYQPNRQADTRDFLVLEILRWFPYSSIPSALGFSLPDACFGAHAVIFYNRIERISASNDIDVGVLLGHAMSHEIGHVLLSSNEHSPSGIMKARWDKTDYQNAAEGCLKFTTPQCRVIRDHAAIRLHAIIH